MKKYRLMICIILILAILIYPVCLQIKANETFESDYSKIDSHTYKEIKAGDLVEIIANIEISNQERQYLESNYNSLLYEDKIPTSCISTSLVDNELEVHADPYSYIDKHNRTVTWIPYSAKLNDVTKLFIYDSDIYKCEFDNVNDEESIVVQYQAQINIPSNYANELINAAYNKINDYVVEGVQEAKEQEYQLAYAEYTNYLNALAEYNNNYYLYLEYLEQKEAYDKYLVELDNYNSELEAYNQYLVNSENYPNALLAYQNYLIALDDFNSTYPEKKAAYDDYVSKMRSVNHQLYIMSLIRKEMTSLKRTIYGAVMGDTVTQVLSRKDELVQLGVPEAAIDRAYTATVNLRSIFSDYFSLTSDREKYTYYCANYYSIKGNLEELLRTLDKLFRSGLVLTALDLYDSTEKYLILVAQLGLVSIMIDTGDVYNYEAWNPSTNKGNLKINGALVINDSWTIYGRTIKQILENVNYVDDSTISPLRLYGGYPDEVMEPIAPEVVEEPTYPNPVAEPVAPAVVSEPTSSVKELPVKPTEVFEPSPYVEPEMIQSLKEVYLIELNYRSELDADYDLVLSSDFEKKFKNVDEITVEFYNTNGDYITKYTINNGSYIVYDGLIPSKEPDIKYSYVFSGWEYEDHEKLDLNNVTKEGFVYPLFDEI